MRVERRLNGRLAPVLFILGACGVAGLSLTPSAESAKIVREVNAAMTGRTLTTTVDSAAATVTLSCTALVASLPCAAGLPRVTTVSRQVVNDLFGLTRSQAFSQLKDEYDMSGTHVDGPSYRIRVVANGFERSTKWSDAAVLPPVLVQFNAQVMGLEGR